MEVRKEGTRKIRGKKQKAEGSSRDLKFKKRQGGVTEGHTLDDLGMAPLLVIPLLCDLGNASSLGPGLPRVEIYNPWVHPKGERKNWK